MLCVRVRGTPKLRAGPLLEDGPALDALDQRVRFQPSPVLSRDEVRKRLIVPSVRISSVVIPLRADSLLGSIELVGVSVCEEPEEEDLDERGLSERKKERPLDFGHPDVGGGATGADGALTAGRGGGRQIGIDAGDAGSEPEASLLVVLVMEAGVVEPDAEGSVESLCRFEDEAKLLRLEMSWFGASTA